MSDFHAMWLSQRNKSYYANQASTIFSMDKEALFNLLSECIFQLKILLNTLENLFNFPFIPLPTLKDYYNCLKGFFIFTENKFLRLTEG